MLASGRASCVLELCYWIWSVFFTFCSERIWCFIGLDQMCPELLACYLPLVGSQDYGLFPLPAYSSERVVIAPQLPGWSMSSRLLAAALKAFPSLLRQNGLKANWMKAMALGHSNSPFFPMCLTTTIKITVAMKFWLWRKECRIFSSG